MRLARISIKHVFMLICGLLASLAVVSVVVSLHVAAINAQDSAHDASRSHALLVQVHRELANSTAILAVLNDCLHPGGKCYARSKASTTDVLRSAEVIIIAAEACTHETRIPSDYSALAVCVDALVRQHE